MKHGATRSWKLNDKKHYRIDMTWTLHPWTHSTRSCLHSSAQD